LISDILPAFGMIFRVILIFRKMVSLHKINSSLATVEFLENNIRMNFDSHLSLLKSLNKHRTTSAGNLLHYLALRTHDLRFLQRELSSMGISSQSHSEGYTLNNLQKIRHLLRCLAGNDVSNDVFDQLDNEESIKILKENAALLLGDVSYDGQTKMMVTLPAEAALDYQLVKRLVQNGMHIARINTAHDDEGVWKKMIANCQRASDATNHSVKIYMDLIGPRLRIASIMSTSLAFTKKTGQPVILIHKGDKLKILPAGIEGYNEDLPAISISLPELLNEIRISEKIWFDEGKLGGVVRSVSENLIIIEITTCPKKGFKLKAGKGINLPESQLSLPALTATDADNLPFIIANADIVGFSFVRTTEDIDMLQRSLEMHNKTDMGIILKIETRKAFDNLPSLLFKAMEIDRVGIMIARGDLAIELGLLRMAEVQEEILWLAEAAHLPVVWATQILETQVKKGRATRAEISDVVKATRSECIMLNKGPYIIDALKILNDLDKRMHKHQEKEHKMLRALKIAQSFINP